MNPKLKIRYCSNPNCSCKKRGRHGKYTHDNGDRLTRIKKLTLITAIILLLATAFLTARVVHTRELDNERLNLKIDLVQQATQRQIERLQIDKVNDQSDLKAKDDKIKQIQSDSDSQINALKSQLQSKAAAQVKLAAAVLQTHPTASVPAACEQYRGLVAQYNWPVDTMLAIAYAESGCSAAAVSPPNYDGLRDYGLFQIHGEPIMDAQANVARAYQKYVTQGLTAWSTYSSGKYLAYLTFV